MVIEPKQSMIAYRCPHCGAGVMSMVDVFALSADMVKLKCTCGKSDMTVARDGEKIRLTVPCIFCPKPHHFTISQSLFFDKDLFVLPCPYSDVNVCFIGDMNRVKAELARTELELLDILEQNGIDSLASLHRDAPDESELTDPQIFDIVMFVIKDLDAEGKIYCKCRGVENEHNYDAEIDEDGIRVKCRKCGASRVIPTDSHLGAYAFLNADSLHLE